jgi:hypothetical protein
MTAGYRWVRPVLDAPGATLGVLVPLAAFVEHFGVPSSGAELSAILTRARVQCGGEP